MHGQGAITLTKRSMTSERTNLEIHFAHTPPMKFSLFLTALMVASATAFTPP